MSVHHVYMPCPSQNAHTSRVTDRLEHELEEAAASFAAQLNTSHAHALTHAHTALEAQLRDALCLKHAMEMQVLVHSLYVIQVSMACAVMMYRDDGVVPYVMYDG